MLHDMPHKMNFRLFSYSKKAYQSRLTGEVAATPSKMSKDPPQGGGLYQPQQRFRLKGLPREAPRLSAICKKVSANRLGAHLCRPGLSHVDFCQAPGFLKHALSSPLINSSQATETFPLHPKACLPPQLIEMDVSSLRRTLP